MNGPNCVLGKDHQIAPGRTLYACDGSIAQRHAPLYPRLGSSPTHDIILYGKSYNNRIPIIVQAGHLHRSFCPHGVTTFVIRASSTSRDLQAPP